MSSKRIAARELPCRTALADRLRVSAGFPRCLHKLPCRADEGGPIFDGWEVGMECG